MKIGVYELVNEDKLTRVLEGNLVRGGKLEGGLKNTPKWEEKGEEEKGELILAYYDKLGGLIMKNGLKVKTGSFWDVVAKAPRKEPVVSFEMVLEDEIVEVTEEEAVAIKQTKERTNELKKKKKKKV